MTLSLVFRRFHPLFSNFVQNTLLSLQTKVLRICQLNLCINYWISSQTNHKLWYYCRIEGKCLTGQNYMSWTPEKYIPSSGFQNIHHVPFSILLLKSLFCFSMVGCRMPSIWHRWNHVRLAYNPDESAGLLQIGRNLSKHFFFLLGHRIGLLTKGAMWVLGIVITWRLHGKIQNKGLDMFQKKSFSRAISTD